MLTLTEITLIAEKVVQLIKPADELMNITRAAEYLNTTPAALAKRVERKQVPFHKKNRLLYFSRNELNDYYLTDENVKSPRSTRRWPK